MENNHIKVLKFLAAGKPQTARELGAGTGLWPHKDPHLAAVRVNAILDVERRRGHVSRAGTTLSSYNNVPAYRWKITPAGLAWLEERSWERRSRKLEERAARVAMRETHAAALVEYLDREARAHNWGRDTPAPERKAALREMQAMGCTLQAMGDVFGISREYVRLILQGYMVRNGKTLPVGASGLLRREGHLIFVRKEDS